MNPLIGRAGHRRCERGRFAVSFASIPLLHLALAGTRESEEWIKPLTSRALGGNASRRFVVTRTMTAPKPYPTSAFTSLFQFTGAYDYKIEAKDVMQGECNWTERERETD